MIEETRIRLKDKIVILAAAWLFLRLVPAAVLEEQVAVLEGEKGG